MARTTPNPNTCRTCGEEVAPRAWKGDLDLLMAEHRRHECDVALRDLDLLLTY
jgi:hypothetical protein